MKRIIIAGLFITSFFDSFSQKKGYIWCFGDSSGIDFNNLSNPQTIHSSVKARGSCASISDSVGQLLFYTSYNPQLLWGSGEFRNGEVYNRNHQLMLNGDLISYQSWYKEVIIIPFSSDSNKYYIFSEGITSLFGLYYSIVDMTLDNGRGEVIQKNVQLENLKATDCLNAIKHGNGRDWWLIWRRWDNANDEFYFFLIDTVGISGPFIQHIGTITNNGEYTIAFSVDGKRMAVVDYRGLIELYDFDRCTAQLSNYQLIRQESTNPLPGLYGCTFSSSGQLLYISSCGYGVPSYLFQFDLTAPDILNSCDTLWSTTFPDEAGGALKLAPDGKIYYAHQWNDGFNFPYPYPDSTFNIWNTTLGVINYPDSLGTACDFQPFGFNLGGGRGYIGLPNNPDYDLGPDTNSICDTITNVQSIKYEVSREGLYVFYHPGWQIAFINAEGLRGKKYTLGVYDLTGREVFREFGSLQGQYFTRDFWCEEFAKGMYVVSLRTEKEVLSKKFIK